MTVERMAGQAPWTVSVAVMPGEENCPELDRLDQGLRKDRGWREGDEFIAVWKSHIRWPMERWWPPRQSDIDDLREALEAGMQTPPMPRTFAEWQDWLVRMLSMPAGEAVNREFARPEYGESLAVKALRSMPIKVDPTLPPGTVELRGQGRAVLFNIGVDRSDRPDVGVKTKVTLTKDLKVKLGPIIDPETGEEIW